MNTQPQAPKKSRKRQSPIYGSPGRGSPMYGSPGRGSPMYGSPGRGSLFNFGSPGTRSAFESPGTRSTFESPVKGTPKKLRALPNSPSILTNQKDAKPGRKVKQLENAVVKSYAKDKLSQESLKNELAVYEHLDNDIMYNGEKIRDLINKMFIELNRQRNIYPGVNLIFPSIIEFENNQLHLTYHHIEDVFIKGKTEIKTTTILGTTSTYETDPVYDDNDLQLLENIKTALKENGIIYADNDLINGEIMSNLFRTNDGNALLLDFETSKVNTSKGGRKKTNRKRNIKKRTRKKRNIKKN